MYTHDWDQSRGLFVTLFASGNTQYTYRAPISIPHLYTSCSFVSGDFTEINFKVVLLQVIYFEQKFFLFLLHQQYFTLFTSSNLSADYTLRNLSLNGSMVVSSEKVNTIFGGLTYASQLLSVYKRQLLSKYINCSQILKCQQMFVRWCVTQSMFQRMLKSCVVVCCSPATWARKTHLLKPDRGQRRQPLKLAGIVKILTIFVSLNIIYKIQKTNTKAMLLLYHLTILIHNMIYMWSHFWQAHFYLVF